MRVCISSYCAFRSRVDQSAPEGTSGGICLRNCLWRPCCHLRGFHGRVTCRLRGLSMWGGRDEEQAKSYKPESQRDYAICPVLYHSSCCHWSAEASHKPFHLTTHIITFVCCIRLCAAPIKATLRARQLCRPKRLHREHNGENQEHQVCH